MPVFSYVKCSRCHKENSALASFCMQCGMALDLKTAVGIQERSMQADNFTAEILAELMEQVPDVLANIIAEKGGIDRINKIAKMEFEGELTSMDSEVHINNIRTYFISTSHQPSILNEK